MTPRQIKIAVIILVVTNIITALMNIAALIITLRLMAGL